MIFLWITLLLLSSLSCGNPNKATDVSYSLDREFTNKPVNILKISSTHGLLMSISGERISADVPLGKKVSIKDEVEIYFDETGSYTLAINFFQEDGSHYLKDELTWEYSAIFPKKPVVSFKEKASNSERATLYLATSTERSIHEFKLIGDFKPASGDIEAWMPVPSSHIIPVTLADFEGMQSAQLIVRNKFGNESSPTNLSILRKSDPPQDCNIEVKSLQLEPNGLASVRISATNSSELEYFFTGDLKKRQAEYSSFDGEVQVSLDLVPLANSVIEEERKVEFFLRDVARNYCITKEEIVFNIKRNYKSYGISIKDQITVTPTESVTVVPHYDRFSQDQIEMYLSGGIVESPNTFKWIPFSPEVAVKLQPIQGTRHVFVDFRENGVKQDTKRSYYTIKLDPSLNE